MDFGEENSTEKPKRNKVKENRNPFNIGKEHVIAHTLVIVLMVTSFWLFYTEFDKILEWEGIVAFTVVLLFTVHVLMASVYAAIVLFGDDKLRDKGNGELMKILYLPIYVIMTLISRLRNTEEVKGKKESKNKTKMYFSQDILDKFNTKVVLDNGYVTYLNNIIVSDIDGVRTTVESRELDLQDSIDKKRALLVDGVPINENNVEEFYDSIYTDYKISKDFQDKLKEYKKLEKEEQERLEDIEFINHNSRMVESKKKEVEHLLYSNVRQEKVVKMRDNIEKELINIKKRVEDIGDEI